MPLNVAQKLIRSHLASDAQMSRGEPIGLEIDQTLTQDATGTMVMLEFEAMEIPRVRTQLSAQYVDHNLLQTDSKNPDDHVFLQSACRKYGVWFSRPGNGVSHPVHMERFGVPGQSLLGSDSHSCAAGSLGMLAIGAGGLDVATALAGEPFHIKMPEILGVRITGALRPWVSAKDVILEMLRRHGVKGGVGKIIEYYGPGLDNLSAMDRHVIANMGAELGATTTVFPSDARVREFLRSQEREDDWRELLADRGCEYDSQDEIDLEEMEPLIACPGSPGNVVPVEKVAGAEIYQAYIGSSANPGFRDFAIPALMVDGRQIHPEVSFDVNPTSRQILETLIKLGLLDKLVRAGARLHQTGCNGCIGMGQAPATGRKSLRTVPRNFPGRSGAVEDQVYLCSPETATASALTGAITDPRSLGADYPRFRAPTTVCINRRMLSPPPETADGVELVKGPNIASLPEFEPLPDSVSGPVLLKVGDDLSTDEIMPAGSRVLPFRSNVPAISKFAFHAVDETFHDRAKNLSGAAYIVGGHNYGQGSSREHAALAPRYLGVQAVLAKSFARIHEQNLVNFAILPLRFTAENDYGEIEQGDELELRDARQRLKDGAEVLVCANKTRGTEIELRHELSERQIRIVLDGSLINFLKQRHA